MQGKENKNHYDQLSAAEDVTVPLASDSPSDIP